MATDGKRTIEETNLAANAIVGSEIVRLSVTPYNTTSTNRYTRLDAIMTWLGTQLGIVPKFNLQATTDPSVHDDLAHGYSVNSIWYNKNTGIAWYPRDLTNSSAIWNNAYLSVQNPQGNADNLTASDTQDQAGGTLLDKRNNFVGTVTVDGDSLRLLPGVINMEVLVYCAPDVDGNPVIFPNLGEKINGVVNAPITLFKGNLMVFKCVATGVWIYFNSTI